MNGILQKLFKKPDGTAGCVLACFFALFFFAAGGPQDTEASEPSAESRYTTTLPEKTACAVSAPEPPAEPLYKVVSPLGKSTIETTPMAPRMATLAGQTVCMVWNNAFKADITLPAIGEALKKQYPGLRVVSHTDMPDAFLPEPPGAPREKSSALQAAFKTNGCNAVISGNGG